MSADQPGDLSERAINAAKAERRRRYIETAIHKEVGKVANAGSGARNSILNSAAYNLAAFGVEEQRIRTELTAAAERCGLVKDDGVKAVEATIASGTTAGYANPRQIPINGASYRPRAQSSSSPNKAAQEAAKPQAASSHAADVAAAEPKTEPKIDWNKPEACFDYTDRDGKFLYQNVRYRLVHADGTTLVMSGKGKPDKTFRLRRKEGGRWVFGLGKIAQVPYKLPDLIASLAADRTIPVLVPEGEAKVDLLHQWGIPATQIAKGTKDYAEFFRDADVILVPDKDDTGFAHINEIGAALSSIACRVRVLMLPGLDRGGDVVDWAAAGGTVEQLWALVDQAPHWMPPIADDAPAADADDGKARADAGTQALIDELARLNPVEYDRRRTQAANELGIRRSTLDNAREARRADIEADRGPPPLFGHWGVEPWPEPVGGDVLLLAIKRRIRRYIVLTDEQAITVASWILMAWAHQEAAVHSPILLATSVEANSGKTTLINLVGFLVPRGMPCVGTSEAALFRIIELYEPTVIVDEADTAFVENEALRAVVNSGWTRGSGVLRCTGDENTPHLFPTFCPKAIGMKGRKLPDTTLSRCIIVEMKRKKPSDRAEHFEHVDDADLGELRRQCMRWSMDNAEMLRGVTSQMPAGFDNRLGDNWRLMFAIADLAGGEWPARTRQVAIAISKVGEAASFTTQLLSDIREIFRAKDNSDHDGNVIFACERVASTELVSLLVDMQDRPWPELKNGKPLTETRLARLLSNYKVVPKRLMIDGIRFSGYFRGDFEDAWERYLPADS
jgi:Protein of unknown function (DUF3631)